MFKFLLILLCVGSAFSLSAQVPNNTLLKAQSAQEHMKKEEEALAAKSSLQERAGKPNEVMMISPQMRAKDLQSAFEYLKRKEPGMKINIELFNKPSIKDILDIDVMPGGTLVIFIVNTVKGIKYRVVKTEEIDSVVSYG